MLAAVFAFAAIAGHGGVFLAWKTDGDVQKRCRRASLWLFGAVAITWPVLTVATGTVNPVLLPNLRHRPLAWLALVLAVGGLASVVRALRQRRDLMAFLGSSAFLVGMLAATAACLFPVMLRSIDDPARSLTAFNAAAPASSLRAAIGWWIIGAPLAVGYFVFLFRVHRGKVVAAIGREGY